MTSKEGILSIKGLNPTRESDVLFQHFSITASCFSAAAQPVVLQPTLFCFHWHKPVRVHSIASDQSCTPGVHIQWDAHQNSQLKTFSSCFSQSGNSGPYCLTAIFGESTL